MIEQTLCFHAVLRLAADAQALGDRLINQLFLGCFGEDHFEGFAGNSVVDLSELEVALQAAPPNRSLLHFVRRITESKALVVEVTILAQARDHRFHDFFVCVLPAQ